ncbi:MAG TPA: hypothetical protein VEV82_07130 [Actinomycetota bacterium]|nr:hypothetical protein [Actinomycetota bacterium]
MNRKTIIGALLAIMLLTAIIGANLVIAGGTDTKGSAGTEVTTSDNDNDNLECPKQGLPACEGQMNDDASEGPEEAEEAEDANEKGEAQEGAEHENEGPEGPDDGDEKAEAGQ